MILVVIIIVIVAIVGAIAYMKMSAGKGGGPTFEEEEAPGETLEAPVNETEALSEARE
jgi:flagellar basal body-associated protein FliL